jgi:glycosyltransferase involved in cell wall biosynthesis
MKILIGVPRKVHAEICYLEVEAFRKSGAKVFTSIFGNTGEVKGAFKSALVVFKNAFLLCSKSLKYNSEIVYLNTAFDKKTIIRDSITVCILKLFKKNVKIVLKLHGSESTTVFSKNCFKKYLLNKIDLLLVLSLEERNNFLCAGLNPAKIEVTANAINKLNYTADPNFKTKLQIPSDCIVLLFVGRFIKEKGILDLVESCKIIKEKNLKVLLLCIGDGALKMEVQHLIKQYELSMFVRVVGYLEENQTQYFYSNCDILILPTYHAEGFPMAVFRAVAAGKSIITTKIRAAADYFQEYKNCLWVKEKDPRDLFKKISYLLSIPELRKEMGRNNIELAENFTADVICNATLKHFARILLTILKRYRLNKINM